LLGADMPFWVYVIRNKSNGRYYCGQTSDINKRIQKHNNPTYNSTKTTKRIDGPWTLFWPKELSSRSETMLLEKKIK
jgi:putative endonuclease